MKIKKFSKKPADLESRIGSKPVICYPNNTLPDPDLSGLKTHRKGSSVIKIIIIPRHCHI